MVNVVGVDIYLQSETIPDVPKEHGGLKLVFISNRGTRIWPGAGVEMKYIDVMRCRYEAEQGATDADIIALLKTMSEGGFRWAKAQKLLATESGEKLYSQPY